MNIQKFVLISFCWLLFAVPIFAQDTARPGGGGGERDMTESDLVELTKSDRVLIAKEIRSQLFIYDKALKECSPSTDKQQNLDQVFFYLTMLKLGCNRDVGGIKTSSCDEKSCEALECLRKEGALAPIDRLLSNAKVVSFWRDQSQLSTVQVLQARRQILKIIDDGKSSSKL